MNNNGIVWFYGMNQCEMGDASAKREKETGGSRLID